MPPAKDVPPAKDKPSSVNYLVPPAGAQPSMNPVPLSEEQMPVAQSWTAEKGRLLKDVIEDWGRKAGVDVSWQAEYDYPLQASVSFMGSFEEAVRGILVGFQEAQPQPVAYLYNSQSGGQAVLVVQARGNNYTE